MSNEWGWPLSNLRSLSEQQTIAQVRDSLILIEDGNYRLRIAGHSDVVYTDWYKAVQKLEELLDLRPFTFDVGIIYRQPGWSSELDPSSSLSSQPVDPAEDQ
jgi:hypothetical protein